MKISELKDYLSYCQSTGNFMWEGKKAYPRVKGKMAGSVNAVKSGKRYLRIGLSGSWLFGHRLAWAMHYGSWPDGCIDHINGNGLDNRIANLRCVSHVENMRNQRLRSSNSSGVTGVSFDAPRKKWVASITVKRKGICLGRFTNKEDAIKKRKEAEFKYGFHVNHGTKREL